MKRALHSHVRPDSTLILFPQRNDQRFSVPLIPSYSRVEKIAMIGSIRTVKDPPPPGLQKNISWYKVT